MSSRSESGHYKILISLVLGAALGVLANSFAPESLLLKGLIRNFTRPLGQIFINLLMLGIIPLVFASLALGVTRLGGGNNLGRIGFKTISYFVLTTTCAACIGLTLVNSIKPGNQISDEQKTKLMAAKGEADKKLQNKREVDINLLVNIVPSNPLKAFSDKDMLAVIFTSLLVGVALTRIEQERAQLIVKVLEGVNQITDFILGTAMKLAPYAVFCLIFTTAAEFGWELLVALAAFVATVLIGLGIQLLVVFPILVKLLGGMNPLEFFRKSRGTMITAFSTSSSSATLPTAMKCAEEELGVPKAVSRFVLPLSASMNHNGTALFEGVTVMFLAQVFGVDLTLQQQLIVLVMCVITATGLAGVPGGSIPLIGLILAQNGVQPDAIAIVLGVDRLLDMCRTMVNVTGDLTTTLYVSRSERENLKLEGPPPEPAEAA
ncbi:dicarboxylate/amino acid:cation symporter [Telmatocola sphagniphila]|uniref:Dicarboxylate/amino acid:cation symporter n=1 Tax=Telmatocola sphagniphila TaxID=1123043 RepID=A0A8E6B9I4_9BACT|nr:dicarboxylate/amino acid:cation symporter [Telmatocola sphagniphila]QVL34333.1 dicarboxylate/amino acid:cation symporter [Telmatocola sphagniphila]